MNFSELLMFNKFFWSYSRLSWVPNSEQWTFRNCCNTTLSQVRRFPCHPDNSTRTLNSTQQPTPSFLPYCPMVLESNVREIVKASFSMWSRSTHNALTAFSWLPSASQCTGSLSDTGAAAGFSGGLAYRLLSHPPMFLLPDVKPSMYLQPATYKLTTQHDGCNMNEKKYHPSLEEKSFSSHTAHKAALISVSLALSQTPVYTASPWKLYPFTSQLLPVLTASTHRGKARLSWPGWMIT